MHLRVKIVLKWIEGRQGGGYFKMALIPNALSEFLKADAFLLKLNDGCEIKKHKDPAVAGYKHFRLNITLWKSGPEAMYVYGPIKRFDRIEFFRPDLYEHGMDKIYGNRYILSFGWLTKE